MNDNTKEALKWWITHSARYYNTLDKYGEQDLATKCRRKIMHEHAVKVCKLLEQELIEEENDQ